MNMCLLNIFFWGTFVFSKYFCKMNFLRNFVACGLLAIFILVTTVDKCVAMDPIITPTHSRFGMPAPAIGSNHEYQIKPIKVFYKIGIAVSILLICLSFRYFYVICNQMTNLEKEKRKKREDERRRKEEEHRKQREEERRRKEEEQRKQREEEIRQKEEEHRKQREEERKQKEKEERKEQKRENKTPTGELELETKQSASNFNTGMKVNKVVLGTGLVLTCAYALINEYFKIKSKNSEENEALKQISFVKKDAEKSADKKVLDAGDVLEDTQNIDNGSPELQDINVKKARLNKKDSTKSGQINK